MIDTDKNSRHFLPAAGHDLFLPLYDPLVRWLGFDRSRQELISQANIKSDQHVLDIGCGTGTFILLLKRQFPHVQVVGLDPDSKALHRARKKVSRAAVSVQLDHGFADELPYGNASFDRVFSSFMFHHLEGEQRQKTLNEVVRVLKPGGSFHFLDFVANHAPDRFFERLVQTHARTSDNTHESLLEIMSHAGFTRAQKVKEDSMLFGLLRAAYYRASV
jgi:ubiquinone/menaquinone biosynthesis C-methylase UbiE